MSRFVLLAGFLAFSGCDGMQDATLNDASDANGDGLDDAVVILTQETGGSGTFFYVAAAVASPRGVSGTAGLFVGDRIAPNTVSVRDGRVTVSYLTRGQGQSFAEKPAVEQVLDLLLSADGVRLRWLLINQERRSP